MSNNELYGTLVLVHPDLKDDPARQHGKVGVLTYIDSSEHIYVTFLNNAEGKYTKDNLFQLRDREELFTAIKDSASIGLNDYKDLYKIGLLQNSGRSTDLLKALEIAGHNPAIRDKSLVKLEELIAPKLERIFSR